MIRDELDIFLERCLEMIAPYASYNDDDRAAYEKLERVRRERIAVREQLARTSDALRAVQYRRHRWFRWCYPLDIIWRKPWKSSVPPFQTSEYWLFGPITQLKNLINWIRFAHDCADPAIACSCHPSYRFPDPNSKETNS